MRSKMKLYTAALVAMLVGLPLAEEAKAQSTDVVGIVESAIGLAAAITSAAVSLS
jgi:hypothetical protein